MASHKNLFLGLGGLSKNTTTNSASMPASPTTPRAGTTSPGMPKRLFPTDLQAVQLRGRSGSMSAASGETSISPPTSPPTSTVPMNAAPPATAAESKPDFVKPSALRSGQASAPWLKDHPSGTSLMRSVPRKYDSLPRQTTSSSTKKLSSSSEAARISTEDNTEGGSSGDPSNTSDFSNEQVSPTEIAEKQMRAKLRYSIFVADEEELLSRPPPPPQSIMPKSGSSELKRAATAAKRTSSEGVAAAVAAAQVSTPTSSALASSPLPLAITPTSGAEANNDGEASASAPDVASVSSPVDSSDAPVTRRRRNSLTLPRKSGMQAPITGNDETEIMTKEDLEKAIDTLVQKSRELSMLCTVKTKQDAIQFRNNNIVFQFKDISTFVLDLMHRLSSQVDVSPVIETSIKLAESEKWVLAGLDELRRSGMKPIFGEPLKQNLLGLLSAAKKAAIDYMMAVAKAPPPLLVAVPGFRLELGRLSQSVMKSIKNRMSYSFSTSASMMRNKSTAPAEEQTAYADVVLEHIDDNATFYRKFFFRQDHRNYLGIDEKIGPVAVSIKKEPLPNHADEFQYRCIFRTREGADMRAIFSESSVIVNSRMRAKPSWTDVIQTINPSVNPARLKKVLDSPKLEDELAKFDEHRMVTKYKFGVMYMKGGQVTEEEMFGNEHGSEAFESFLDFLGDRVKLTEHTKYAGGLSTSNESTGSHSVYREWRNFQVMFHVSTLMPFSHSTEDRQQIQRKRHIGNDIVTLVFIDGYGQYDPRTIKSQFLHVFIAIQRIKSTTPGVARYRVAVGSNEDVPEFGPWVPKPAEFDETDEFRHFLFAKMINGENAAYKAPKFRDPHERAREGLVTYLVESMLKEPGQSTSTMRFHKSKDSESAPMQRKALPKHLEVDTSAASKSATLPKDFVASPRAAAAAATQGGPAAAAAASAVRFFKDESNDNLLSPIGEAVPRPQMVMAVHEHYKSLLLDDFKLHLSDFEDPAAQQGPLHQRLASSDSTS